MALLQCCFEGAEYVELLDTHDPNDEHDFESGEKQASKQEILRPPRELSGILGAVLTVLVGIAFGGLVGQHLWLLLRNYTTDWCHEAKDFMDLGLHAAHLGKAMHSAFCHGVRGSTGFEMGCALVFGTVAGPSALRLLFGRAYFTTWSEMEELQELQRLYCERSNGSFLVLLTWRAKLVIIFIFDIVIWMWFRYYLDLYLDVQAMEIFGRNDQWQFFSCNLLGIVLGLFWTAVEFYKALRESKVPGWSSLPGEQVLLVGLCLPLAGLHMTYLAIVSLTMGCKHRFLYISALAEAILESAVSAFVQTYAVVFSKLSIADKMDLYSSIALSFISIGFAFSSLDKMDGGELLVHLPGSCRSSNTQWWIVFIFRVAEVSSRATSLALFQQVWRPYGLFAVVSVDIVIIVAVAAVFQYHRGRFTGKNKMDLLRSNLVYALPSVVCLMTPMLEKDTPLTVPPGFYYILRLLELAVMFTLMAWRLDCSLSRAELLFNDDAFVVATFASSTVIMVLLGTYLRNWLAFNALLEAPMEVWYERPFTLTQQVLRNRILLGGGSPIKFAHFNLQELIRIMRKADSGAKRKSWEIRAILAEEGSEFARTTTRLEWDALFLSAKVSACVERSLQALEEACAKHNASGEHSGTIRSSRKTLAAVLHAERREEVRLGSLVSLGGKGGCLTAMEGRTEMCWPHDRADQKFALAPAWGIPLGERVLSGSCVRLRALENGYFLATTKSSIGDGRFALELQSPSKMEEASTVFTIWLTHEEEYLSAHAFARQVDSVDDELIVTKLAHGGKSSSEWSPHGWKIACINDVVASREMVDDLLAEAKYDVESEFGSFVGDCDSPIKSFGCHTPRRRSRHRKTMEAHLSRIRSVDECTTPGTALKEHFKVRFEKIRGKDMSIRFGDKVVLRDAGAGDTVGAAVSFGKTAGEIALQTIGVEVDVPPATLILSEVEYGSRDESGLYQWVASEVEKRVSAMEVRSALPEKLKNAIVSSYNARTDLPHIGVLFQNKELHLHLLRVLNNLLCGYRSIEITYDCRDEALEELRLYSDSDSPITVGAIDSRRGSTLPDTSSKMSNKISWVGKAAEAGIRIGDELVEIEVDKDGDRDRFIRSLPSMRAALHLSSEESSVGDNEALTLIFHSPRPVDSGVQAVAARNALMIAQLLPGWEESYKLDKEGWTHRASTCLFRYHELFRLKCRLVTAMLHSGWEIRHMAFAEDAVSLHEYFKAVTLEQLESMYPGKDARRQEMRESILVAQLDVLTASWAAVPRTVKEHQPEVLRSLFRTDCELVAMRDGLRIVYKAWKQSTQSASKIVEMPIELQNFVERVRPISEIGSHGVLGSIVWIMKAWSLSEQKEVHAVVQSILSEFMDVSLACERYWSEMLRGSAEAMEEAQASLERALATADVRVVLVNSNNAARELGHLQQVLTQDHLVLKTPFKPASDSDVVPQGHRLIRRGHVMDFFGADVSSKEVHRRLLELAPSEDDEGDLRLLFSSDEYKSSRENASRAIEELGVIIRVVQTAAKAFPDTVLPQSRALLEQHHHGELKAVTLENRRRIQVQEREAQEMVRTANMRLSVAEAQKVTAQRKLREAEEEKVMAEDAKLDAQNRAQNFLELYETLQGTKERLEAEKSQLQNDQAGWWKTRELMEKDQLQLKKEKEELEKEKNEWTITKHEMEQEQQQLQAGIQKAKEERKRLEEAAEKWQNTLVSVKVEAESKERHLKEIQAILQKAPTAGSMSLGSARSADTQPIQRVCSEGRTLRFKQDNVVSEVNEIPVLQQLWAVVSKAFGSDLRQEVQKNKEKDKRRSPRHETTGAIDVIMTSPKSRNSKGGA